MEILMEHGAGGEKMFQFLREFVLKELWSSGEVGLDEMEDSGIIDGIVLGGHRKTLSIGNGERSLGNGCESNCSLTFLGDRRGVLH